MMSRSSRLRALTGALLLTSACIFTEESLVSDESGGLDMSMSADQGGGVDLGSPDLSGPDQDAPEMSEEDMGCVPAAINAEQICDQLGRACGEAVVGDSCGGVQTVACPDKCSDDQICSGDKCMPRCTPLSEEDFCNRGVVAYQCGTFTDTSCGVPKRYNCGICKGVGEECDGGQCSCTREDDQVLCARRGIQCGEKTIVDNCGMPHEVRCDGCGDEKCSEDNKCPICTESDEQFCVRLGATCGMVSGMDRCGTPRQGVQCGSCATGLSCGAQNTCVCEGETDAELCAQQRPAAVCGRITVADRCGARRDVDCGLASSCAAGPSAPDCSATNQCCYPESERAMQRAVYTTSKRCGTLPATICGQSQAIQVNCNNPEVCCNGICMPTYQCAVNGSDMGVDMGADTSKDMDSRDMSNLPDFGVGMDR